MYKLYYSPLACSLAVNIALEKVGLDFEKEKIDISKGEHQTEAYLKLNKHGKVPLLQDGDALIDQAAAILLHLAEKHPESEMIPTTSDPLRAQVLSKLFYVSNTLHPAFSMAFYPDRYSEGSSKDVLSKTVERIKSLLDELELELADSSYLNGEKPYVADYYLVTALNWPQVFNISLDSYPQIQNYKQRMADLPEVSKAMGFEVKEYYKK